MIIFREVSLRRGPKVLLDRVNVTIQPGQHIALIGANGSGKSSVFAMLLGQLAADQGSVEGLHALRIGCMEQEVQASKLSALEYVMSGDVALFDIHQQLQVAEANQDYDRAAQLHTRLDDGNGYDIVSRAEKLLLGLGFQQPDLRRPVSDFSGGWRIRLNLGKALMTPSDLLLLDEPTNHLDLDASFWLKRWLQNYPGTLLLISHDRDFIDACCQQVLHLEHQTLTAYKGNYSAFERQRAERLAQQQANYEKQQRRVAEIEDFVRRFRYKATKAKQAQSRLKELQRMPELAPAHIDSPFSFRFPEPRRAGDPILSLTHAACGYADVAVLAKVNLQIHSGARLGLLGKNGAGKSTLLKTLTGQLPLIRGDRVEGAHCQIGYFDQHQLEALDLQASPALHLQRISPDSREQEIYDFLGGFNFRGELAKEAIRDFSGGEKARLALAITVWQKPNVLIMDEPTNHLDLEMRHALTVALQAYEGAVVLVTHDRYLLSNTVDELVLVHDGVVEAYEQDLEQYEQWILSGQTVAQAATTAQVAASKRDKKQQRQQAAQQRAQLQPLKKQLKSIERRMQTVEEQLGWLDTRLSDTGLYQEVNKPDLNELLREQGALRTEQEALEEQWLELQEKLELLN